MRIDLDDFMEDYSEDPDEWTMLSRSESQAVFDASIERLTTVTAQRNDARERATRAEERADRLQVEVAKTADRVRSNRYITWVGVTLVGTWGWLLYEALFNG